MVLAGHVKNGVIVLDRPEALPEGTPVLVSVPDATPENGRTLVERLQSVVGKAKGLPEDAASNVDHYLYGHDKRT